MPRTTTNHKRRPVTLAVVSVDSLFHRIHALLHTVRSIAQHEDELCTLLHASRNSDSSDDELNAEVRALLDAMPAHDFEDDLESLRAALPEAANVRGTASTNRKKIAAKKVASPIRPAKKAGLQKALVKSTAGKKPAARKAMAAKALIAKPLVTTTKNSKSAAKKTSARKTAVGKPVRSRQLAARKAGVAADRRGAARRSNVRG